MNIIAIDPDWKRPGFAVWHNGRLTKLGTFDLRTTNADAELGTLRLRREFTHITTQYKKCDWDIVVENPIINTRGIIYGKTKGEVMTRGYGLAKCTFAGGLITGIASQYGTVHYIEPVEWNSGRKSKKQMHADLKLSEPEIKRLRDKHNNGVTDDSLDAVLIGRAYILKKRLKEKK